MKIEKITMSNLLIVFAVISLVFGLVFIQQGISRYIQIKQLSATERVTIAIPEKDVEKGELVDSLKEMEAAGDLIRSHRQGIAHTYGELLSGQKFDPTNPKQLLYAQAINLENYLYLGALSFGVIYLMMGLGVFMIVVAISLWLTGMVLRKFTIT